MLRLKIIAVLLLAELVLRLLLRSA